MSGFLAALLAVPLLKRWGTSFGVASGLLVDDADLAGSGGASPSADFNEKTSHGLEFNEKMAQRLVLASDASYCGDEEHGGDVVLSSILDYTCPPCMVARNLQQGGNLVGVKHFVNQERGTFGFVGKSDNWTDERESHFVVAFRGSVTTQNFVDDYDFHNCTKVERFSGCVTRGYYNSYASIKDDMLNAVGMLKRNDQHQRINSVLLTGHSLGGTQAVYAALDLASTFPDMSIRLYAFAPPMPGDAAFADSLNKVKNLKYWAVVHQADTVPVCGIEGPPCPQTMEENLITEIDHVVWYPGKFAPAEMTESYKVCQKLEDCRGNVTQDNLTWSDHEFYLSHMMYCCHANNTCQFPVFTNPLTELE